MAAGVGSVAAEIERRIVAALRPTRLVVRDDSAAHRGHAGHRPEGETHFHVEIVSPAFSDMGRVARQRAVYAAVGDLMASRIHALSIRALAPEEPEAG